MQSLLGTAAACRRELYHSVEKTAAELVACVEPVPMFQALLPQLSAAGLDGRPLQLALRTLSFTLARLGATVTPSLPRLMPLLFTWFQHASPDVRKAVVFALVDVYTAAGAAACARWFKELTPAQSKLVSIYIDRRASTVAPRLTPR